MARDKFYEARICGYIAAFKKAKEEGLEALERDIKKRNIIKADLNIPERSMDELFGELSRNLYHNTMTAVGWTLHDVYGFGKKRIQDFKKSLDKTVQDTLDLDYMGEHYVKLEDYAIELNERYDIGINIDRIAVCTESYDEKDPKYRTCKVDKVIKELKENNFLEAAAFLERKLD